MLGQMTSKKHIPLNRSLDIVHGMKLKIEISLSPIYKYGENWILNQKQKLNYRSVDMSLAFSFKGVVRLLHQYIMVILENLGRVYVQYFILREKQQYF